MHESDWISAHLFHHGDLDILLTQLVAPLLDELDDKELSEGSFFLRYWDGGPHLRLRVLPVSGGRDKVEELITERCAAFFRRRPAAPAMDQEQYATIARTLAGWEQVPAYSRALYPNNSLHFIAYCREHGRYGDGASVEAAERHFGDSSRIALRVLTLRASAGQRAAAARALILLTWFCAEPDPARIAGWITSSGRTPPDRGGPLPGGAERFEPVPDLPDTAGAVPDPEGVRLARQMRALMTRAARPKGDGTLEKWAWSVIELRDALLPLLASGEFTPPPRGWEGPGAISAPQQVGQVLTVLDICAHLVCNRMGLPLAAEGAARRWAAEAVRGMAEADGGA